MTTFFNLDDLLRPDTHGARIVPVSKGTFYRMVKAGTFPKPRRLGKRSVWPKEDIEQWREQWLAGDQ